MATIRSIADRLRYQGTLIALKVLHWKWRGQHRSARALVVAERWGRLANRLTVLCNLVVLARRFNLVVVDLSFLAELRARPFPVEFERLGTFHFPPPQPLPSPIERLATFFVSRWRNTLIQRLQSSGADDASGITFERATKHRVTLSEEWLARGKCVILGGIFYDTPSFTQPETEWCTKFFQPRGLVAEVVSGILLDLRTRQKTLIGVHVRQGDYRHWNQGKFFFEPAEYASAMLFLQNELACDCLFVVVSDEPQCSECYPGLDVSFPSQSEEVDMYVLSRCDYLIGTHSSFVNWAAFVGQIPLLTMRDAMAQEFTLHRITQPRLHSDYVV